jgi:cleavage and polyadenylation specificity factor subunit 6/7
LFSRWTTDANIASAISDAGVTDFEEVKFFENRINGQSKGFCCVTLGSESSQKIVIKKLTSVEINGQVSFN